MSSIYVSTRLVERLVETIIFEGGSVLDLQGHPKACLAFTFLAPFLRVTCTFCPRAFAPVCRGYQTDIRKDEKSDRVQRKKEPNSDHCDDLRFPVVLENVNAAKRSFDGEHRSRHS